MFLMPATLLLCNFIFVYSNFVIVFVLFSQKEAERLHEERSHHEEERIKMSLVEQELVEVRRALQKAEAEMESIAPKMSRSLQQWLFITYRRESKHFIMKKNNALKQLEDAKEAVSVYMFILLILIHLILDIFLHKISATCCIVNAF